MPKPIRKQGIRSARLAVGVFGIALVLSLSAAPAMADTVTNGDIVYDRSVDGGGEGEREIYRNNITGTNEVQLTDTPGINAIPSWSPDGTQILFSSTRDGNSEIYKMDEDGGNQTNLTNDPGTDQLPTWSPDGIRIAFNSDRNAGNNGLWTMLANGTDPVQLTDASLNFSPMVLLWSPDAATILASVGGDILSFSSTTTGQTGNNILSGYYGISWSPDGLKVLLVSFSDGEFYTMNPDGSGVTQLTSDGTPKIGGDYSPDGTQIVFTTQGEGFSQVGVMPVDGSSQTIFLASETIAYFFISWQPIITPDPPAPTPTPENRASERTIDTKDTLPAAGLGAAGYGLAIGGLAAVRFGKKRWDLRRRQS